MKRKFVFASVLTVILAAAASAADISGNWKGTASFQGQTIARSFVFKVDGSKLTGETTSELLGKSSIDEGKIEGDNIAFTITASFQGNPIKVAYKGKISGDTITLSTTLGSGMGPSIEWTLKRS